jgi:phage terminase large subunit-like protein
LPGRPKKSLLEHVEDRSFRAREHAELLETSSLLRSKALRTIQSRYQRASKPETLRKIALEFERALQALLVDVSAVEWSPIDEEGPPLEQILDELGPPHSAERVINFFPRFLRHVKGPKAGLPFELDEWQKDVLREAFRRNRRGRRVYRLIYLIVPGGNGKSPLAAGLSLEALCEFLDAPDVLCLAGIKDQADVVADYARGFVQGSDEQPGELTRFLRVRGKQIVRKVTSGLMRVVASSGASLEGAIPSVVVVDELQAFKDKRQEHSFVALIGKLFKRPEAYAIIISTAGRGAENFLHRRLKEHLHAKTMKVTRRGSLTIGRDETEGVLVWMYAAPKEAPLTGKAGLEAIKRANPATWIEPEEIMKLRSHVGEAEFRRLARNEQIAERNQWMPMGAWEKCVDAKRRWTPRGRAGGWPPEGTEIVLGFDGSYNNDSTALVGCTKTKHLFVVDVWEKPEGDPEWIVPRDVVTATVDAAMERWKVLRLVADPPGWYDEIEAWAVKYGDVFTTMFPTNQIKMMAEACKEFYGDVVNKKLTHDGHPVLAKHLANAYTRETADGAYIVKERRDSPDKIDAAVAAVIARYLAVREKPKKKAKLVSW